MAKHEHEIELDLRLLNTRADAQTVILHEVRPWLKRLEADGHYPYALVFNVRENLNDPMSVIVHIEAEVAEPKEGSNRN